ncbi:MAG: hypothetical protein ACM3PF_11670 [Bacteroidota bacterium]
MARSSFSIRAAALPAAALAVSLLFPACQRSGDRNAQAPDSAAVARADSVAVRNVVLDFGNRMKLVPLLAPDSAAAAAIRRQYGTLVAPELVRSWTRDPRKAPGRLTSSPWPDRIEIQNIARKSARVFLVDGLIAERTSAGAAPPVPVRLAVWKTTGAWRITEYDQGSPGAVVAAEGDPALDPQHAADVLRAYYDLLRAGRYQQAYEKWEAGGTASGGSLIEFVNRNAQTKVQEFTIGAPGPMGAAAGSRYVEVPVHVVSLGRKGAREAWSGTYTLRRAVVDGATPEQRAWHIYSSNLKKEPA